MLYLYPDGKFLQKASNNDDQDGDNQGDAQNGNNKDQLSLKRCSAQLRRYGEIITKF